MLVLWMSRISDSQTQPYEVVNNVVQRFQWKTEWRFIVKPTHRMTLSLISPHDHYFVGTLRPKQQLDQSNNNETRRNVSGGENISSVLFILVWICVYAFSLCFSLLLSTKQNFSVGRFRIAYVLIGKHVVFPHNLNEYTYTHINVYVTYAHRLSFEHCILLLCAWKPSFGCVQSGERLLPYRFCVYECVNFGKFLWNNPWEG